MHILPSGRLPRSVVPKRYDLTLAVEPKQGKFSGAVSIDLEIHEATPTIILHAVDLQITQALFEGAGLGRSAEISLLPALTAKSSWLECFARSPPGAWPASTSEP